MTSKPFPINTNIHPVVQQAHETLTARHKATVAAAKAEYETRLEQRWLQAEQKRKADWLTKERLDNPPRRIDNPYSDLSDAGVVRIATPSADRIRVLGECFTATQNVDFLVESLKVWLYRRKSKASLSEAKAFLSEWIPTEGSEEIFTETRSTHFDIPGAVGRGRIVPSIEHHVIADGLSPEAVRVLRGFKIKSGMVYWVTEVEYEDRPGQPVERWKYAHQDESILSSEY